MHGNRGTYNPNQSTDLHALPLRTRQISPAHVPTQLEHFVTSRPQEFIINAWSCGAGRRRKGLDLQAKIVY